MSQDGRQVNRHRQRVQGGWATPGRRPPSTPTSHGGAHSSGAPVSRNETPRFIFHQPQVSPSQPQVRNQSAMAVQAEMPPNFSWVVEGELCAMGMPKQVEHMQFLQDQGVRYLVSLTAEASPPAEDFPDIDLIRIKIKDFTAPTMEQVDQFLAVVARGKRTKKAVAVHCRQGKGRTAVMLACYFVHFSNMSAQAAIQRVRRLRRGSLVMPNQADVVVAFQRHLAAASSSQAAAVT